MSNKNHKITPEDRRRMAELNEQGMTYKQIAKEIGCHVSTVQYSISGHSPSRAAHRPHTVCPSCGKRISPSLDLTFCYHCGADIRSDAKKVVQEVWKVIDNISMFYPQNQRDHAVQTLNKVLDILKGAK